MNKKINIAIIGCGRIAGHHCRAIKANKSLELIAVCDLENNKSDDYGHQFNAKSYTDYDEMIVENPQIDIVSIVTPSGMHFEHSFDVLTKYKKHIVVEKPTFMKPSEIRKVYGLAEKNNTFIFPVFQNRYNSAVQKVKESIENGELGEPRIISVRVRWCRPQRYYEMSKWRGTFSHDGGALTNQGIHHVDLLRYLGGEVSKVNCTMATIGVENVEVEDTAIGSFIFKNNSVGSL